MHNVYRCSSVDSRQNSDIIANGAEWTEKIMQSTDNMHSMHQWNYDVQIKIATTTLLTASKWTPHTSLQGVKIIKLYLIW